MRQTLQKTKKPARANFCMQPITYGTSLCRRQKILNGWRLKTRTLVADCGLEARARTSSWQVWNILQRDFLATALHSVLRFGVPKNQTQTEKSRQRKKSQETKKHNLYVLILCVRNTTYVIYVRIDRKVAERRKDTVWRKERCRKKISPEKKRHTSISSPIPTSWCRYSSADIYSHRFMCRMMYCSTRYW